MALPNRMNNPLDEYNGEPCVVDNIDWEGMSVPILSLVIVVMIAIGFAL